ncbi:IS66 family insertion sequence element accessory protein TnpA [Neomoorella thermoacetica]|uniref:IS66 family insertion sequence element accessory protein TnpA n=1 Tax=Neomoorella thermoacetica TaxID=1525 RepID=UPI001F1A5723|nr:hypothetical protein [Moorella thermoacetica]
MATDGTIVQAQAAIKSLETLNSQPVVKYLEDLEKQDEKELGKRQTLPTWHQNKVYRIISLKNTNGGRFFMTKAELQKLWEARIAEYRASGQSVKEWCASHNVSPLQL